MKPTKLPAQIHEAFCPRCDARVEYALFGASFYDFGSFLEICTGALVRMDLDAVQHQKFDPQCLLTDVAEGLGLPSQESHWIDQSEELYCARCKAVFKRNEARGNRMCFESEVDAYNTPPRN